jgi:hypothetical protein
MIINLSDKNGHMHICLVTWSSMLAPDGEVIRISPECVTNDEVEYWLQQLEKDIAAIRRKLKKRRLTPAGGDSA